MNVIVTKEKERTIAEIVGRVDTTTAPEFQKLVTDIMTDKPARLILDCARLEYISSAGLRALLIIAKNAKAAGINVNLCALTDFVVDVLATSGFDSFFEIKKDKNE
ncbi:MAG: STAS domain-containing protein [Phascolarctobacterium sp.]|nr:STAS domain-containing protein [Candidatus Phascolarctobacterium caballi]MCQ2381406.1 STAS domain-containing protein [Acidaminococcaceae bacterium]